VQTIRCEPQRSADCHLLTPPWQDLDCSRFWAAEDPIPTDSAGLGRYKRAMRLCALYHRAYLIVPPDPPPAMTVDVMDALLVGCVPVFLGKPPGYLAQPDTLPEEKAAIRVGVSRLTAPTKWGVVR
jgi:hypothetical protein